MLDLIFGVKKYSQAILYPKVYMQTIFIMLSKLMTQRIHSLVYMYTSLVNQTLAFCSAGCTPSPARPVLWKGIQSGSLD